MYRLRNSFADCTLLDILHWIYQGALYFQNFIWVHGTRVGVISFTPITIVRHSQCRYSQNSPSRDKLFLDVYCTRLYQNWMKRVINWAKFIFLLLIKFVSCARLYHNWMKRVTNWAKCIFLLLIKFVSCASLYHNWTKRVINWAKFIFLLLI